MKELLLVTIPAVLVLIGTFGGRFLEHYLQTKAETKKYKAEKEREYRDALRRDREKIVEPIRKVLADFHANMATRDLYRSIESEIKEKGISVSAEVSESLKILRQMANRKSALDLQDYNTKIIGLVASITDEKVRKQILQTLLYCVLDDRFREQLGIKEQEIREKFNASYQELENYVTLADK